MENTEPRFRSFRTMLRQASDFQEHKYFKHKFLHIMKKVLVFGLIAGAGFLMGSCSKDAANSEFSQNAIEFGTYLGRDAQTKGAITSSTSIQNSGFGVTAFYTGQKAWAEYGVATAPNFMYNQKVEYATSAWSYSPVKYWPTMKGDKISFFAYAPYKAAGIALANNNAPEANTSLTFTVQDDAANMVDFVAAQVIDATQKDAAEGGHDAVNFTLKHELSRLAFKVKTSDNMAEESHVVLKEVDLAAGDFFYKSATYKFADATTANDVKGTWSNPTKMSADYNVVGVLDGFQAQTIGGKTYTAAVRDLKSATAEALFKTDGYLFLIPVEGGLAENKAAVTFKYDIVTKDANLKDGYSCTEATKTVYLPAGLLQQGKAYNVTFTFNVDQIEVAASVADWATDETSEVKVPFTPDDATATTTTTE